MELNCTKGQTNTGQACVEPFRVPLYLIFVPLMDSLGNLNEIDLTQTFDAAYFSARVNDTDESKRWYPLPFMKNVSDKRADPEFQTWNDGSKSFIEQGIKDFMGITEGVSGAAPQMEGKMNSMRGLEWGVLKVDKSLNLQGKLGSDSTHMAPVRVQSQTIFAVFQAAMDKSVPQINFGFNYDITEKDSEMRVLLRTEMDYNLSLLTGLMDVTSVVSGISTAGFTIKLLTDGGTMINRTVVKNLVTADFVSSVGGATGKVRDTTSGADRTITVAESPAGVYTVTPAVPFVTAHVLVVKIIKAGYDFTEVTEATVTIP